MRYFFTAFLGSAIVLGILYIVFSSLHPSRFYHLGEKFLSFRGESSRERIQSAHARSARVKGVYVTADVARDRGIAARALRERILTMLRDTELNGVVVDVKEANGVFLDDAMKVFVEKLHEDDNTWVIARLVSFRDNVAVGTNPGFYLKRRDGSIWRDNRGGAWMDPASPEVWRYVVEVARRAAALGFDEIQFDYIRFPSDGDVAAVVYPAWTPSTPRNRVIGDFASFLHKELKAYRPEIILSADLFGDVAVRGRDDSIGQNLEVLAPHFDYLSFMVYPSHYYHGLDLAADPSRGLEEVRLSSEAARANPDVVVSRSLLAAEAVIGRASSGTSSSAAALRDASLLGMNVAPARSEWPRLRPWLEDFFHEEDQIAGRPYGREKMRRQIDAAESVAPHGWLLWNPSNVYTESALRKE